MTPQDLNNQLNKISFTKHLIRCSITAAIFMVLFRALSLISTLEQVVSMLYWWIGFDLLFGYFCDAKVYYLRSALSYCTIALTFCVLQLLSH